MELHRCHAERSQHVCACIMHRVIQRGSMGLRHRNMPFWRNRHELLGIRANALTYLHLRNVGRVEWLVEYRSNQERRKHMFELRWMLAICNMDVSRPR